MKTRNDQKKYPPAAALAALAEAAEAKAAKKSKDDEVIELLNSSESEGEDDFASGGKT